MPAAKKPRKPATVKAKNARMDVTVDAENGRIGIKWPANCGGGERHFNADDLRAAIEDVERCASFGDDVWYEGRDSRGERFFCVLKDGRLHAHDHTGDDLPHVSWSAFKRAMVARIGA